MVFDICPLVFGVLSTMINLACQFEHNVGAKDTQINITRHIVSWDASSLAVVCHYFWGDLT